jgi:hypothetical protein
VLQLIGFDFQYTPDRRGRTAGDHDAAAGCKLSEIHDNS